MRANLASKDARRGGFTLIEILIVVAIIGLLAGISMVAMRSARSFTGAAVVKQRLDDVAQSLESYKIKYGEYPPDCCATKAEIKRHILKRWPNALKSRNVDSMVDVAYAQTRKGPGYALLFWLAGMDGEGFIQDDKNPIADPASISNDEPREQPIIELQYDSDGAGGGNYNESGIMFQGNPIIYFRADKKEGYHHKDLHYAGSVAAPYMKNGEWYNPDSFQLIYPGADGNFGSQDPCDDDAEEDHDDEHCAHSRDLGNSATVSAEDKDNITNFTSGATIESMID